MNEIVLEMLLGVFGIIIFVATLAWMRAKQQRINRLRMQQHLENSGHSKTRESQPQENHEEQFVSKTA